MKMKNSSTNVERERFSMLRDCSSSGILCTQIAESETKITDHFGQSV